MGTAAYFHSPVNETIAMELTILRVTVDAMSKVAHEREAELKRWRDEALLWRAVYDRDEPISR
jgi:hypothetical protein